MSVRSIDLEIFQNLMTGIAEHMSATVERTAYTSFVRETHDFGAAMCTPDGTFFTYPRQTGVTTFVGLDVGDAIRSVSDIEDGDVIFTNDPYNSGALCSHLTDLHMFSPVFVHGELVCYCWGFIHSSDIGGKVAGSISPTSYEVFQEGLRIPPMRLYRRGEVNADLQRILECNVRIPTHVWGDLEALRASFHVAATQIARVVDRFGLGGFRTYMSEIMDYSEAKARAVIAEIPDGQYEFVDYLEDDFVSNVPVRVKLTMAKRGTEVHLDYTGTDPQVMAAVNIPTLGKRHAWITAAMVHYLLSEDPSIPANGGMLRPFTVTLPRGTLVNPIFPAAMGARVVTGVKILEVTLGALGRAVPNRVPAAGSGQGMIVVLSTPDMEVGGSRVNVLQPLIGGSGGRPTADGFDGSDYTYAFLRNTPAEVLEAENAVVIRKYFLRCDSGGPGEFRGGLGVGIEFQVLLPQTLITARGMERTKFAPWGTQLGRHGGRTTPCYVNPGTDRQRIIDKIDIVELEPGDVVLIQASGAGGYGDPLTRDAERVQNDLEWGFISRAHAEQEYGVRFLDGTGEVDLAATVKERRSRSSERDQASGIDGYDFGEERTNFEAKWPPVVHDELLALLEQYPILMRGTIKNWIIGRALASSLKASTVGQLMDLWHECELVFRKE